MVFCSGLGMISPSAYVANGSRYYYTRLTNEQKTIYSTMLLGLTRFSKKMEVSIRPINETSMVFNSVLLDNPSIFYVSTFIQENDLYKGKCIIIPEYSHTRQENKELQRIISEYLLAFDAIKAKNDSYKELFIHDFCLNHFIYDYSCGDYSHTILGPVLNKAAVCEGIAKFAKLVFDYIGLSSLIVVGKARNLFDEDDEMEDHSWNIVRIEEKTYHLDITFDISLTDKIKRYDYFNLSDEDIKKEHIVVSDTPKCAAAGEDYYSTNSLLAYKPIEFENQIRAGLIHGKKSIVVKLMNAQYSDKTVDKIKEIARRQYTSIFKRTTMLQVRSNPHQMVFEINFK